jgi:hypothetical protein
MYFDFTLISCVIIRDNLHFTLVAVKRVLYIEYNDNIYIIYICVLQCNSNHCTMVTYALCTKRPFKGSVQRKLRWVENGVIRTKGASDYGAGHSFVVLFVFHLDFTIFLFPVTTTQIIGEFWQNRWSGTSDVALIVLALYRWHSLY